MADILLKYATEIVDIKKCIEHLSLSISGQNILDDMSLGNVDIYLRQSIENWTLYAEEYMGEFDPIFFRSDIYSKKTYQSILYRCKTLYDERMVFYHNESIEPYDMYKYFINRFLNGNYIETLTNYHLSCIYDATRNGNIVVLLNYLCILSGIKGYLQKNAAAYKDKWIDIENILNIGIECYSSVINVISILYNRDYQNVVDKLRKIIKQYKCKNNSEFQFLYDKYLESWYWKTKKTLILSLHQYQCDVCGNNKDELQVHHKPDGYKNIGNERPIDLAVLCNKHHALYHGKEMT